MPTLQPLWELDPPQYLTFCKFPELAMSWKPLGGERRLTEKDRASMIAEADAYKESLWQLSDAEIEAMVEKAKLEEKARHLERLELQEKQRPFHQPYARADVSHWASASYWTLDEGVALSLGKEPRITPWTVIQPIVHASAFARTFNNRRDLVHRAKTMGQLRDKTSPADFIEWAERMRFSMPGDLVDAVKSVGIQVEDWKSLYDRQKTIAEHAQGQLAEKHAAHMAAIKDHSESISKMGSHREQLATDYNSLLDQKDSLIALKDERAEWLEAQILQLESDQSAKPEKSLGTRERDSLLKLVIGMAVGGYGFDPKAARNPTAKEISNDLQLRGIGMDEDTVRKYLAEAKQLLPGDD